MLTRIEAILARLIGFDTVSERSNLALIDWVEAFLTEAGFAVTRIAAPSGAGAPKAGLLARFGTGPGGVLYSAHSDVVPVAGQRWSLEPFALTRRGDRYYGRGTTDMKGFLACVLALAETLRAAPPLRPVLIALSWDEEIGCRGIPEMIGHVLPRLGRPDLCVIGEPSGMRLGIGHKGKASYQALCHGEAGHSALAPRFCNALHLAADLIGALRAEQALQAATGPQDPLYDVPYATVHAGRMQGGVALNIVPEHAEVSFEIRHLAAQDPDALLRRILAGLPEGIVVTQTGRYPGLDADPTAPAIARLATLLPDPAPIKVSYGTEAGFFAALGLPSVVCGPGDMADGHQPDESISLAQVQLCAEVIGRLVRG